MRTVHTFFDESGSHAGAPVLCVAGYAFEKRASRMLAREWNGILGQYELPFFHMVDCAHGNESFSSLTKKQRIKAATSLIGIVKRHAAHGFAISVDTKAFREIMPPWGPTQNPYAFCTRCVIDEMGRWFFRTGFRGKSAYFFEAGLESLSEAAKVIRSVLANPFAKMNDVRYGYVAHSFIAKQEAAAVQAADLLAWQWAPDVRHQMQGRPRRKDFESLSQAPPSESEAASIAAPAECGGARSARHRGDHRAAGRRIPSSARDGTGRPGAFRADANLARAERPAEPAQYASLGRLRYAGRYRRVP